MKWKQYHHLMKTSSMWTKLRDQYPRHYCETNDKRPKPYHSTLLIVIGLSGVQFGLKSQFIISEKKERHDVQLPPFTIFSQYQ